MFKCKQCGKEVCQICFDRSARLCVDCVKEARGIEQKEVFATAGPSTRASSKNKTRIGMVMLILGLVSVPLAFVLGAVYVLNPLVIGATVLIGFSVFLKGFLMIKS
jgi:hypothetical protein